MKRAAPKLNGHHDGAEPGVVLSALNGAADAGSGPAESPEDDAQVLRGAGDDVEVGNALQAYLRDIRRTPLLTPQQ